MKTKFCLSISFLIIIGFYSCSDEPDTINSNTSEGLNGKWQFIITPLNVFIDTTTVKGKNGNDFITDPSINDEIYLYQTGNQINGFTGPFELRGTLSDSIRLDIFEPAEGRYGEDTSMLKSSEMTLIQNSMGFLEGTGRIILDWDTTGVKFDTYRITANKISNITASDFNALKLQSSSSWLSKLCDLSFDAVSFLTSKLTDDIFRPMGNCWGHKHNGGFYVFGHTGPGSIFPVWTQTVYFPMEWSFCKTRRYHFNLDYDGAILGLSELEDLVTVQANWLRHIGFVTIPDLLTKLRDFYNQYGNFAIIIGYNYETGQGTIYVIVENGNPNAHTHPLVTTISDEIYRHFHGMFYLSGRNVRDEWHLKRSDFFICNTPLLFCYIFGTVKVNLN